MGSGELRPGYSTGGVNELKSNLTVEARDCLVEEGGGRRGGTVASIWGINSFGDQVSVGVLGSVGTIVWKPPLVGAAWPWELPKGTPPLVLNSFPLPDAGGRSALSPAP